MTARVRPLLAAAFAIAVLAWPATAPTARAATPDLTIVSSARYDVQPARHLSLIHI